MRFTMYDDFDDFEFQQAMAEQRDDLIAAFDEYHASIVDPYHGLTGNFDAIERCAAIAQSARDASNTDYFRNRMAISNERGEILDYAAKHEQKLWAKRVASQRKCKRREQAKIALVAHGLDAIDAAHGRSKGLLREVARDMGLLD